LAQKTIGLAVGNRKFKAVEMEARFGEFSIHNYWISDLHEDFREKLFSIKSKPVEAASAAGAEQPPAQEASAAQKETASAENAEQKQGGAESAPAPEPVAEKLIAPEHLMELSGFAADLSIGLPSEICFYREIDFPFSDLKKINQVIRLEAEGFFPFPIDDYLVDFLPPFAGAEANSVLTFLIDRNKYSGILNQLKSFYFDPAFTGVECLTLPLLALKDPVAPRLWLEIGAARTMLVGSLGSAPFLYRRIPAGTGDLISRLAGRLSVSTERAEKFLIETDISADSERPEAKIIRDWLYPLLAQVKQTLHWYERNRKGGTLPPQFEQLVLSGGGANISGIEDFLSRDLGIPASKFRVPGWISRVPGFEFSPENEVLLAEPISLALARLSKEGKRQVNFRKGEFAHRAQYQVPFRKLAFPAALLLVMVILGIAKAGTQYSLLNKQTKQINQEISQKYVTIFPGAKPSDPVSQLKQAFTLGKTRLKSSKDLYYPTAVECLAAIGDKVPKDVGYQLSKFSYNKDKLRLDGETLDFTRAKDIVDRLGQVEFFKKVNLDDSRSGPNGKVNFAISIELKNPAEIKGE